MEKITDYLSVFIEGALRKRLISRDEAKRLNSRDCYDVGIVNRLSLAMPFDYSALNMIFCKKLASAKDISAGYLEAIVEEPEHSLSKFEKYGLGASCLAGSYLNASLFELFGLNARVVPATKKKKTGALMHYAVIVEQNGQAFYTDNSLNLIVPLPINAPQLRQDPVFDITLKGNNSKKSVWIAGDGQQAKLWDLKYLKEDSFENYAKKMQMTLDPSLRDDPVQYFSHATVVCREDIKRVWNSNIKGNLFRVKISYDKQNKQYHAKAQNRNLTYTKNYAISHDRGRMNQLSLKKINSLERDIYELTGTKLPSNFFEELNNLNKMLLELNGN